jgi:multidrug resistance efflux pump
LGLVAAVVLLWLLFGEKLLPAIEVEVVTVVTTQDTTVLNQSTQPTRKGLGEAAFSGAVQFQASGWLEAEPYSYRATALTSGVVETVHALEGEKVKKGAPLATLIDEDAELLYQRAQANHEAARAAQRAAQREYERIVAKEESIQRQIATAEARREELADLAKRATELGPKVISEQEISQAKLRLNTQEQAVVAIRSELRVAEIETEMFAQKASQARALVDVASSHCAEAKLALERTVIRAPISGVVQRLFVTPGQKRMLAADNPESATVALIFDPSKLQARVDVPLADAYRLFVGQAVLVESEYFPGQTLHGLVERIDGEADLQRNTLQAKVRIKNPPTNWRPEVLCRAKFLDTVVEGEGAQRMEPMGTARQQGGSQGVRVYVPRAALDEQSGDTASVWALDESGKRAVRREVWLSGAAEGGYLAIVRGLRPGDRVVLNPSSRLYEGIRVKY